MCGFFIIDALGSVTGIRYSGHHRIRTNFGGILTLFCIIIAIITIFFYGNVYIQGSEMSQVFNQQKFWNGQNITLDQNFIFAIANRFDGKIDLRQDIFSTEAYYVKNDVSNYEVIETKLKNFSCKKEDWIKVEKQFNSFHLEKALCFQVDDYEISGNKNTEWFNYIRIKYLLNLSETNETWNKFIEKSIQESDSSAQLYFLEGIFEMTGKKSNINYFINSVPLNISYYDMKELTISISKDELVLTEDKLFYSVKEKREAFSIFEVRETASSRIGYDRNLLNIDIVSSRTKNSILVSFLSFSDLLARIGGIVNNIITVFFLINYIKNYWSYEIRQFNSLIYQVEEDFQLKTNLIPTKLKMNNFIKGKGGDNLSKSEKEIYPEIYKINENPADTNNLGLGIKLNDGSYNSINLNNSNFQNNYKNSYLSKNIYTNNANNLNESNNALILNNNVYSCTNNDLKFKVLNNTDIQVSKKVESFNQINIRLGNNSVIESKIKTINKEDNQLICHSDKATYKKDFNLEAVNINSLNKIDQVNYNGCSIPQSEKPNQIHINAVNTVNTDKEEEKKTKILKVINNILFPLSIVNNNNNLDFYEEIKQYRKNNNKEKFEIGLLDYIFNKYLCGKAKSNICIRCFCLNASKKYKTYDYLNEYMNNSLDIKNYERNYFQLNMLKYLLLSQEQMKAFEKFPLFSGYEIIKKQIEYSKTSNLNYSFKFDSNTIETLSETDQKVHSLFVGFNC